ncbi:MAG: hypothetical protein JWO25_3875 [Alphaproteobacteria bacterium]|nr:hypothetical protein [Alphaproteobacteria bacterium]
MNRNVKWLAASLLVAGSAAAPSLAHDPEQKQKIVIMTDRESDGDKHEALDHRASQLVIAECSGDKTEVSGGSEAKGEKARIVICNRGNASAADRTKRLEHVIERINSDNELSVETRAQITTALRDAINRLAAAH